MAEVQESSSTLKGTDTKAIGVIGAILVSVVEAIPFTEALHGVKQATLVAIPFFSSLISSVITWAWNAYKPQDAQIISLRRGLKKAEREIKAKLDDPDIPEETKNKLRGKLKKITLEHVNSFDCS